MAEETLSDTIGEHAKGPKQVTVDGTTTVRQPLRDQVLVEDRQKGATAAGKSHLGFRFRKLKPPGGGL